MKKNLLLSMACLTLLTGLAACSNNSNSQSSDTTTTTTSSEKVDLESLTLPQLSTEVADNEAEVELSTSMGKINIKLFPEIAPKAVENFLTHAKEGYYNGLTFHRVINEFMIQGGDPKGDGTGGESIWGDPFENEPSNQLYHIRGALAMANTGQKDESGDSVPSNGSQFFIVQNNKDVSDGLLFDDYPTGIIDAYKKGGVPSLDGDYTVFGQVISGMDVVDKIAAVETVNEKPTTNVTIDTVTVLKEAQ